MTWFALLLVANTTGADAPPVPWNQAPSGAYLRIDPEDTAIYGVGAGTHRNHALARRAAEDGARAALMHALAPVFACDGQPASPSTEGGEAPAAATPLTDAYPAAVDLDDGMRDPRGETTYTVLRLDVETWWRHAGVDEQSTRGRCARQAIAQLRRSLPRIDDAVLAYDDIGCDPVWPCSTIWQCGTYDNGCGGDVFCSSGCWIYGAIGVVAVGAGIGVGVAATR